MTFKVYLAFITRSMLLIWAAYLEVCMRQKRHYGILVMHVAWVCPISIETPQCLNHDLSIRRMRLADSFWPLQNWAAEVLNFTHALILWNCIYHLRKRLILWDPISNFRDSVSRTCFCSLFWQKVLIRLRPYLKTLHCGACTWQQFTARSNEWSLKTIKEHIV